MNNVPFTSFAAAGGVGEMATPYLPVMDGSALLEKKEGCSCQFPEEQLHCGTAVAAPTRWSQRLLGENINVQPVWQQTSSLLFADRNIK